MKPTNCLEFVSKGMNERIFEFAQLHEGAHLIAICKKLGNSREEQIKELLIAYNSFFMVQGAVIACGFKKSDDGLIEFMLSDMFKDMHNEIVQTVQENFQKLMDRLNPKQKRKLEALFV
jgi:hypothetical protein